MLGQKAFQVAHENGYLEICDIIHQYTLKQDSSEKLESNNDQDIDVDALQLKLLDSQVPNVERQDNKLFQEVLIHIDLKGAPPIFEYLKKLIQYIGDKY